MNHSQGFPSDSLKAALLLFGIVFLCSFLFDLIFPCKKWENQEVYHETCYGEKVRTCSGSWQVEPVCVDR